MITPEKLLLKTESALPGFSPKRLHPIEKGGSSRLFFRVHAENEKTAILVCDLGEKEENRHYARLAGFLSANSVPVPRILAEKREEGLLWLEDLGEEDLWSARNEPWEVRRPMYESVLQGISLLHRIPPEKAEREGLHLQLAFDGRLYRWEQEYFAEHCLGGLFGISKEGRHSLLRDPSMAMLASDLAALPRQLVHRDFQSQNILIRNREAWFIDFQGMRPGLFQYDLASLLCDPYVEISEPERSHLLNHYLKLRMGNNFVDDGSFLRLFWRCAVQRLMQALGAYGFLTLHCGKDSFRTHVAPALSRLREALNNLHPDDRLDGVALIVENLKP